MATVKRAIAPSASETAAAVKDTKKETVKKTAAKSAATKTEETKKEVKETEKKEIQKQADTQNYENVILLLQGIDKTLQELLAQQKSTNYILGELKTSMMNDVKNNKEILGKLENLEKRQQRYGKYN